MSLCKSRRQYFNSKRMLHLSQGSALAPRGKTPPLAAVLEGIKLRRLWLPMWCNPLGNEIATSARLVLWSDLTAGEHHTSCASALTHAPDRLVTVAFVSVTTSSLERLPINTVRTTNVWIT